MSPIIISALRRDGSLDSLETAEAFPPTSIFSAGTSRHQSEPLSPASRPPEHLNLLQTIT